MKKVRQVAEFLSLTIVLLVNTSSGVEAVSAEFHAVTSNKFRPHASSSIKRGK